MEEWRDVKDYIGLYQVSNYGRVRSLFRYKKILKPVKYKSGYLAVGLCKDGKQKMIRIHRLIAGAFIENPNNLPQVNHKNGNKEDNKIDNLEWVSSKENIRHGFDNGLITRAKGNKHYKSKKVQQYDLQGNLIKEWDSINEAQKQLNIGNISKCCRKDKNYTTVGGYIWRYVEENEFMEEK